MLTLGLCNTYQRKVLVYNWVPNRVATQHITKYLYSSLMKAAFLQRHLRKSPCMRHFRLLSNPPFRKEV